MTTVIRSHALLSDRSGGMENNRTASDVYMGGSFFNPSLLKETLCLFDYFVESLLFVWFPGSTGNFRHGEKYRVSEESDQRQREPHEGRSDTTRNQNTPTEYGALSGSSAAQVIHLKFVRNWIRVCQIKIGSCLRMLIECNYQEIISSHIAIPAASYEFLKIPKPTAVRSFWLQAGWGSVRNSRNGWAAAEPATRRGELLAASSADQSDAGARLGGEEQLFVYRSREMPGPAQDLPNDTTHRDQHQLKNWKAQWHGSSFGLRSLDGAVFHRFKKACLLASLIAHP